MPVVFCLTTDQLFCFPEQDVLIPLSRISNSCHSLFRDELLLEEWHSWTFPSSQIHIQIFHRTAWLFYIDLPNHGEDGFHAVRCVRRHVEIVVPHRFRILLTFLVNWRTCSVCQVFLPSFIVLGNRFSFVVPGSSRRIVWVFWISFFLMRRVSPLLFHQPAKVCILESHLRRGRCVDWVWFNTHPAIGFFRSCRHPMTFRCKRTRCGGGTCRNKIRRRIHHCWSRLGHNSFFFSFLIFESSSPLWRSWSRWNS